MQKFPNAFVFNYFYQSTLMLNYVDRIIINNIKRIRISFWAALKSEDPILMKRARHVITEIQRTREAADALKLGQFDKVKFKNDMFIMVNALTCFTCARIDG